jgi:hypothetical protein
MPVTRDPKGARRGGKSSGGQFTANTSGKAGIAAPAAAPARKPAHGGRLLRHTAETRAELTAMLHKKFDQGYFQGSWGRIGRTQHPVFDALTPASLCGRYTTGTTSAEPHVREKFCRECRSLFRDAVTSWLKGKEGQFLSDLEDGDPEAARNSLDSIQRFRSLLAASPKTWDLSLRGVDTDELPPRRR